MQAKKPDSDTISRRVAVVLGATGSGQYLLHVLRPLLGKYAEIDLQGIFIEDDELQRAAMLPFSKELCRLTLSVSDIKSTRFERTMALRTRSAHRAIAGLARGLGISHSFHAMRGSTINLLRETAGSADITIFEPPGIFAPSPPAPHAYIRPAKPRIVVAIDLDSGAEAMIAAMMLAGGDTRRISVILTTAVPTELAALKNLVSELMPGSPDHVRLLPEPGVKHLIEAARAERGDMLVLGARDALLKSEMLRSLMQQLSCPICLVRRW